MNRRGQKIKADISLSVFLNEERNVEAKVFPVQMLRPIFAFVSLTAEHITACCSRCMRSGKK
jgi:hypothetical protein